MMEREATGLTQQVWLTGFGSQEFKANELAVNRVADLFKNCIHGRTLNPFEHPQKIGGCDIFHCHNRYFSDHRKCPEMAVCEFDKGVDPKGILHNITDEYQWLFHSEDNQVKYTTTEARDGVLQFVIISYLIFVHNSQSGQQIRTHRPQRDRSWGRRGSIHHFHGYPHWGQYGEIIGHSQGHLRFTERQAAR